MSNAIPSFFLERLRFDPIPSTVPGSLPVLCFGDLFSASIATVGINPSNQEYTYPDGSELDGDRRRFETLNSLGIQSRAAMTPEHAALAVERMRAYFDEGKPIYGWFAGLQRVVEGMGFSFADRTAAHLDLIQEATHPKWSMLRHDDPAQAESVLRRDLPFLQKQLEQFPIRAVVCTSRRVLDNVCSVLNGWQVAEGTLARLTWSISLAETARGMVGIAGWNIPLAQPTGLNREGQTQLGELLKTQLEAAEICLA